MPTTTHHPHFSTLSYTPQTLTNKHNPNNHTNGKQMHSPSSTLSYMPLRKTYEEAKPLRKYYQCQWDTPLNSTKINKYNALGWRIQTPPSIPHNSWPQPPKYNTLCGINDLHVDNEAFVCCLCHWVHVMATFLKHEILKFIIFGHEYKDNCHLDFIFSWCHSFII
jgi:hypothetical protein